MFGTVYPHVIFVNMFGHIMHSCYVCEHVWQIMLKCLAQYAFMLILGTVYPHVMFVNTSGTVCPHFMFVNTSGTVRPHVMFVNTSVTVCPHVMFVNMFGHIMLSCYVCEHVWQIVLKCLAQYALMLCLL